MEIVRPNEVWAMDITYIPMARGFVYLAVVLDWFSRRVLSWGVSISMEEAFCVETLEDALAGHGKPDIFNTDQGSQFPGSAATRVRSHHRVPMMAGKGEYGPSAASDIRSEIRSEGSAAQRESIYPGSLLDLVTWTFIMADSPLEP